RERRPAPRPYRPLPRAALSAGAASLLSDQPAEWGPAEHPPRELRVPSSAIPVGCGHHRIAALAQTIATAHVNSRPLFIPAIASFANWKFCARCLAAHARLAHQFGRMPAAIPRQSAWRCWRAAPFEGINDRLAATGLPHAETTARLPMR